VVSDFIVSLHPALVIQSVQPEREKSNNKFSKTENFLKIKFKKVFQKE